MSIFEYDKEIEEEKLRKAEFEAGKEAGRVEGKEQGEQIGQKRLSSLIAKLI